MSEPDIILGGYRNWLNDLLFEHKGEDDLVSWIGDDRWCIQSLEGPEVFVIEIYRARVERA